MTLRLSSGVLVCAVALLGASGAYADGISPNDPKIIIGRGTGGSAHVTGLQFTLPFIPNGGGIYDFDNMSGQIWNGLILTVTFPNAADAKADVSCSTDIFSECDFTRQGKTVTIRLTGGEIKPCSSSPCSLNSEFFLDLNDGASLKDHGLANGKGSWKNDSIVGQAITTPEPATLSLLLAGLGGIWLWRKRG